MKDQIISFQTAILADEKGFNIETRESDYMLDGNLSGKRGASIGCSKYVKSSTQSLLQKWLREVHRVNIGLTFHQSNGSNIFYDYCIHYPYGSQTTVTNWTQNNFVSYEEALEEGLQEALKLI